MDFLEVKVTFIGLVLLDFGSGRKGVLPYAVLTIYGCSGCICKVDMVLDCFRVLREGNLVTVVIPIFLIYLLTSLRSSFL